MAPKRKAKNSKNQHQLCAPLPFGILLTDLQKKTWKLGHSIGSGGFGMIYSADEGSVKAVKDTAPYVIKIEPHGNGPLYCEIAFYQRAARSSQIEAWKKHEKVAYVGIPPYIAHGLHERGNEKLRYLVMPRFGSDLHSLWQKAGKKFKGETVAKIAILLIDALRYIHENDYVHADIKGANILCGHDDPNKLYLVDYGLAYRYLTNKVHKTYQPDPRKAHNGTIEYTSTDAHKGANPSRRGDLEILGFYLLHLVAGRLPWEDKLEDCAYVYDQKLKALKNIQLFVEQTCKASGHKEIVQLFQYVKTLEYDEEPDYKKLQSFFKNALKNLGVSVTSPIDYSSTTSVNRRSSLKHLSVKESKKRKLNANNSESDASLCVKKKSKGKCPIPSSSSEDFASDTDTCASSKNKKGSMKNSKRKIKATPPIQDGESCMKHKLLGVQDSEEMIARGGASTNSSSLKPLKKQTKAKIPGDNKGNIIPAVSAKPKSAINLRMKKVETKTERSSGTPDRKPGKPLANSPLSESDNENIGDDTASEDDSKNILKQTPALRNNMIVKPDVKQKSSRYSMAPLHTDTVLTKNDKLTGEMSGKHPVFSRRRKINVSRTNVSTQTTPTLTKMRSRK